LTPLQESTKRERSSDSLTLSSSYSDNDTPNGVQKTALVSTHKSSHHSGKKSGKRSKKPKQAHKNESAQSKENKNKERSLASQRRRAHVLERIRRDSWNTSSDEDNSLTPATDVSSPLDSSTSSTLFTDEGSKNVLVDVERVRADLQRRILSKKPPAHFETPATDPVFHEVNSQ